MTMHGTEILLIRHGESTWNCERRMQGYGDPPLTEKGIEQARRLAESLAEDAIDVLVASDLQRARHTAEFIARQKGLTIDLRKEWREQDMGEWTG